MPVYLVSSLKEETEILNGAVFRTIPEKDRYRLPADKGWFIEFPGTTVELSNHIGVTGQPAGVPSPIGSTLILAVTTYYGRASSDMWEWLRTRLEV